jgi:hypothetical protein
MDVTRNRALRADGIRLHRSELGDEDVSRLGPFRVTSPVRTIIDLAGVLDFDRLEDDLEEALLQGIVNLTELWSRLENVGTKGRKGAHVLKHLLELRDPRWVPTANKFESLLHRVLRNAGLPLPQR